MGSSINTTIITIISFITVEFVTFNLYVTEGLGSSPDAAIKINMNKKVIKLIIVIIVVFMLLPMITSISQASGIGTSKFLFL